MIATATAPPAASGPPRSANPLPEHISPTSARNYLGCSLRFWFEKIARLRKPASAALHLGKTAHAALQAFHLARWRGGDDSPEAVAAAYEKAFADLERDEGPVKFDNLAGREKTRLVCSIAGLVLAPVFNRFAATSVDGGQNAEAFVSRESDGAGAATIPEPSAAALLGLGGLALLCRRRRV